MFERAVLVFQRLQPLKLALGHPTELALPAVELNPCYRLADPNGVKAIAAGELRILR